MPRFAKKSKVEKRIKIEDEIIFLQVLGGIEGMEWETMKGVLRRGVGDGAGRFAGRERREGKLEFLQKPHFWS